MKEQWAAYVAKFAALTQRERIIVALACIVGSGFLGFNFGIDPLLAKARVADKAISQAKAESAGLQAQLTVLQAQVVDPDAANRARIDELKGRVAAAGERLDKFQSAMVPPARMPAFLEGILRQNRRLEVVALKTLAPSPVGMQVIEKQAEATVARAADVARDPTGVFVDRDPKPGLPATPPPPPLPGIYQHGVELTIAGSYEDLLAYLADLEKLPQQVMWQSLSLKTDTYPRNVMTLRVQTLSLDKNWLTM